MHNCQNKAISAYSSAAIPRPTKMLGLSYGRHCFGRNTSSNCMQPINKGGWKGKIREDAIRCFLHAPAMCSFMCLDSQLCDLCYMRMQTHRPVRENDRGKCTRNPSRHWLCATCQTGAGPWLAARLSQTACGAWKSVHRLQKPHAVQTLAAPQVPAGGELLECQAS